MEYINYRMVMLLLVVGVVTYSRDDFDLAFYKERYNLSDLSKETASLRFTLLVSGVIFIAINSVLFLSIVRVEDDQLDLFPLIGLYEGIDILDEKNRRYAFEDLYGQEFGLSIPLFLSQNRDEEAGNKRKVYDHSIKGAHYPVGRFICNDVYLEVLGKLDEIELTMEGIEYYEWSDYLKVKNNNIYSYNELGELAGEISRVRNAFIMRLNTICCDTSSFRHSLSRSLYLAEKSYEDIVKTGRVPANLYKSYKIIKLVNKKLLKIKEKNIFYKK